MSDYSYKQVGAGWSKADALNYKRVSDAGRVVRVKLRLCANGTVDVYERVLYRPVCNQAGNRF